MKRLRILHVGNIANNAYINASLLNEAGHDNHVACYDFYQFAACSEWQDSDRDVDRALLGDTNFPNFWKLGRDRPATPRWFAQGPQARVVTYLSLLSEDDAWLQQIAWSCLRYGRFKSVVARDLLADRRCWSEQEFQDAIAGLDLREDDQAELALGRMCERLVQQVRFALLRYSPEQDVDGVAFPIDPAWLESIAAGAGHIGRLIAAMPKEALRAMGLELDIGRRREGAMPEAAPATARSAYEAILPGWRDLFRRYDVVIGYGPDPVLPFMAQDGPYLAYEHGTLRDIPFEDSDFGRLINAAYANAAAVFVTNTDYLTQARQVAIAPHRIHPVPHAFDERPLLRFAASHPVRRDAQALFFAPARQDWVKQYPTMTKNNHFIVHATRRLVDQGFAAFRTIFVEWGVDTAATKALIEELGVGAHFDWIAPVNKRRLWAHYLDAHAVIDQFLLPSISGVSFEALTLGRRVITCDDGTSNRLAFGSQPPLLPARDVDSVFDCMRAVVSDPDDAAGIGRDAAAWAKAFHSGARIVALETPVFEEVARQTQAFRRGAGTITPACSPASPTP